MRVIVTTVLIAVLAMNQVRAQQPPTDSIKQKILTFPSTALGEIRMKGGDGLRGHIVGRADADFSLELDRGGGTQNIIYDQVSSISQVKTGHSHKKWIIIGVALGAAVVVVVVVFVVIAKTKGPFALP